MNGGYARRIGGVTVDVGAIHSTYSHYSSRASAVSYTELYAGVAYKFLSSRVAFSPHYFEQGGKALYGEINAEVSPARRLHLVGHAGLLVPFSYRDSTESSAAQYDWRVGVSRDVGHASLHLIGSGGGPGRDYYHDGPHSRTALIVGVSWTL